MAGSPRQLPLKKSAKGLAHMSNKSSFLGFDAQRTLGVFNAQMW